MKGKNTQSNICEHLCHLWLSFFHIPGHQGGWSASASGDRQFTSAAREFSIFRDGHPDRRANGDHYVIICDAFICLPFYAVNIRPDSPCFSEIIYAAEESASEAQFVAATFDEFAARLFTNPEESFVSAS